MSTRLLRPQASVTVLAQTVAPSDGSVKLDSLAVPYAQATVVLPVSAVNAESIDPRTGVRATLLGGDEQAGTSRTFDLGVRSRVVDHKAKTLTLYLASDEAILRAYAALTLDDSLFAVQGSLRAVVNAVLAKIGAALAAGGPDADVTTYADSTNLITDPSVEGGGRIFTASDCSIERAETAWAAVGTKSINLYAPTAASSWASVGGDAGGMRMGMTAGKEYVFSATGRIKGAPGGTADTNARRLVIFYRNATGTYVQAASPALSTTVGSVARVSVRAKIPEGATEAFLRVYLGHSGATSQIQWDAFRLSEYTGDPTDTGYYDGGTAATAGYSYVWTGAANASTSRRVALINRPPATLTWAAGDNAWALLEPLTSAAGLRLYCDEHRAWRLVDPATLIAGGSLALTKYNATLGTDTITLDDADTYATGVIVTYTWTATDGTQRSATDTAGTAGQVRKVSISRPYPGPGVAAAILGRMIGRGRQQAVTALADWTAEPAMQAVITLPGTTTQYGKVMSIEWDLAHSLMTVGTTPLSDLIAGSIDALTGIIDTLPGTIDEL